MILRLWFKIFLYNHLVPSGLGNRSKFCDSSPQNLHTLNLNADFTFSDVRERNIGNPQIPWRFLLDLIFSDFQISRIMYVSTTGISWGNESLKSWHDSLPQKRGNGSCQPANRADVHDPISQTSQYSNFVLAAKKMTNVFLSTWRRLV